MAKKTFVVEVDTAAKKQAFAALLTVLGFEKTGPDSFAEVVPSAKPKPVKKATRKPTVGKKSKPIATKSTTQKAMVRKPTATKPKSK